MSLILNIGSNIDRPLDNLEKCVDLIGEQFNILAKSRIYKSTPVDYLEQPDFYNQALELSLPKISAYECFQTFQQIEKKIGPSKVIQKGPRCIDIDIIFWGLEKIEDGQLIIPHPSWSQRSFVVLPTKELPYYHQLKKKFSFNDNLIGDAFPV